MDEIDEVFGDGPTQEAVSEAQDGLAPEAEVTPVEGAGEASAVAGETAEAPPSGNPFEGFVPIAVAQAERNKRQQLDADLKLERAYIAELEALLGSQGGVQPAQYAPAIDPAAVEQQYQVKIQLSEFRAVQQHGAERLQAANQFAELLAQSNPDLLQQIKAMPDPYAELIRYQQSQELLANPQQFLERYAEQFGFVRQQGAPAAQAASPVAAAPQQRVPIKSTSQLASGGRVPASSANTDDPWDFLK
ncbi:MAG: hypothetical protein ACRC56_11915 [Bosea sp. (in: a-proteobacteria)]